MGRGESTETYNMRRALHHLYGSPESTTDNITNTTANHDHHPYQYHKPSEAPHVSLDSSKAFTSTPSSSTSESTAFSLSDIECDSSRSTCDTPHNNNNNNNNNSHVQGTVGGVHDTSETNISYETMGEDTIRYSFGNTAKQLNFPISDHSHPSPTSPPNVQPIPSVNRISNYSYDCHTNNQQQIVNKEVEFVQKENESLKEQLEIISHQNKVLSQHLDKVQEEYRVKSQTSGEERKRITSMEQNLIVTIQQKEQVELRLKEESRKVAKLKRQTTTNSSPKLTKEVKALQDRVDILQKERDSLREDISEILQTRGNEPLQVLERKHQVELEGMRHVAEQVQAEADERLKRSEQEQAELEQEIEIMRSKQEAAVKDETTWKESFHLLVDKLCFLEESGQWKRQDIQMDQIVVGSTGMNREVVEEVMGNSIRRLRLARQNRMDDTKVNSSCQTEEQVANGNDVLRSPIPTNEVDQLRESLGTLSKSLGQLKIENKHLRGSNDQMKEQVQSYREEVTFLKSPEVVSANNARKEKVDRLSEECNDLEKKNAKLIQEIESLREEKKAMEKEYRSVTERCAELENVAEEATEQCESLMAKLAQNDHALKNLECEKEKVCNELEQRLQEAQEKSLSLIKLKQDEESTSNELRNIISCMKMKIAEYESKVEKLQTEHASLLKEKYTFKNELEVARTENIQLVARNTDFEVECGQLKTDLSVKKGKIEEVSARLRIAEESCHDLKKQNSLIAQQNTTQETQENTATPADFCINASNLNTHPFTVNTNLSSIRSSLFTTAEKSTKNDPGSKSNDPTTMNTTSPTSIVHKPDVSNEAITNRLERFKLASERAKTCAEKTAESFKKLGTPAVQASKSESTSNLQTNAKSSRRLRGQSFEKEIMGILNSCNER